MASKFNHCCRVVLFLTLVNLVRSQDLSNLGRDISESVNRQLAPLQNLGARITARVNEDLRRSNIDNLGWQINQQVQADLAPLSHLGQQIEQNVYESLEPVRALEIVEKMRNGIGGATIVTYLPIGTQFLIKNGQVSKCSSNINMETGQCPGTSSPYEFNNEKDHCFLIGGYSIVNDKICIGAESISITNNVIRCKSLTGRPTLLTDLESFRKMCQDVATKAQYRYIADPNHPLHVRIPNKNRYVKCDNANNEVPAAGVCDFHKDLKLPVGFSSRGNYLYSFIENNNSF